MYFLSQSESLDTPNIYQTSVHHIHTLALCQKTRALEWKLWINICARTVYRVYNRHIFVVSTNRDYMPWPRWYSLNIRQDKEWVAGFLFNEWVSNRSNWLTCFMVHSKLHCHLSHHQYNRVIKIASHLLYYEIAINVLMRNEDANCL